MKKLVKNGLYSIGWLWLLLLNNAVLALDATKTKTTTWWDNGTNGDFITTLDNILSYVIGLLYFIALLFCLYGGFTILTAWWEEDKVKKWKTTLINAVIWLIVIFLASQIVHWIISLWSTTIK
jgi:hypothetical protein